MSLRGTVGRTAALSLCLVVAAVFLARASTSEPVPVRAPLAELPFNIDQYRGTRSADMTPEVLAVLGVEEYLNRVYRGGTGLPVGLYVGYYASQREGDTMHSPMNCLPGSGWVPVQTDRLTVPLASAPGAIEINRVLVEKSGERMLVFYWYQSHGRVVASEYWSKIHMVVDAMRTNRTDAAMIRVVVPIPGNTSGVTAEVEQEAVSFVRALFPLLERHLPI
jgi:EpsI family protein